MTSIGEEGPVVHGPAMERPQLARGGLILEVLTDDEIMGKDSLEETHVYCRDRDAIRRYESGEYVGEHSVPERSLQAYLREVDSTVRNVGNRVARLRWTADGIGGPSAGPVGAFVTW